MTTSVPTTTVSRNGQLDEATLQSLRTQFRGPLVLPSDAAYDAARKVYNGMIDKRPALIAQCADVADVIAVVNFGREHRLDIAVRSGGHHGAGFSVCDDGLVIDLSRMKGTRVDPVRRTVTVQGGCVWGDVDHATHPFGLAVPSGIVSTTGVGGLTLGGGLGYLTRTYGLTIDNLLGVDIVLADGRFVAANADENTDLYWAVRGGGGNFGVVTSFQYKLNPVDVVYGGPMMWPIDHMREMMRFWRDFILAGPNEINGWFGLHTIPPAPPFPEIVHSKKMCIINWCYTGPMEKAEEVFRPIRAFDPPVVDFTGPIPWPALQTLFDALYPPGLQWYWKADFYTTLTDQMVDLHVKYGSQLPTPLSGMHIYPVNGAAHRVGKNDTAWSYRDADFASVMVGVDPDPANNARMIQWAKDYWLALHPYSAGGGYVNMFMDEGEDRVKAAYRDNYGRLAQVKAKYDPTNLFHGNQNIRLAAR